MITTMVAKVVATMTTIPLTSSASLIILLLRLQFSCYCFRCCYCYYSRRLIAFIMSAILTMSLLFFERPGHRQHQFCRKI